MTEPLDLRDIEARWVEEGPNSDVAQLLTALRAHRKALEPFSWPTVMNGREVYDPRGDQIRAVLATVRDEGEDSYE